ncbi:MAG: 2Fe-2S iron-sulfur cluster-binding protein [Acidobacteriota bacterium]
MNSENEKYVISFVPATHRPVRLKRGAILSEHLTIENSPVLFGCRTGICGTCLSEILSQTNGELAEPMDDEKELLEIIAPDNPRARLICQIAICADLTIHYLGKS